MVAGRSERTVYLAHHVVYSRGRAVQPSIALGTMSPPIWSFEIDSELAFSCPRLQLQPIFLIFLRAWWEFLER